MARRIVDLTQTLYQGIRGLETEQKSTIADVGCNTTTLHLYSHAGTHMDAPLHFVDGGDTIDNVLLERCIGPAAVFDLTHKGPNTSITIEDMLPYADRIHPGARVILRTDWSLHAEMEDYRPDQPRISPELASWFVERQIALIGVEPASVASLRSDTGDEITVVHQILLKAGIVVVEGLANLRELRQDEIEFIVLPLKIRGCDGSPVRAIAIETVSSEEEALPALEPWQSPETKVTLAAAQIACVSDSGDNIKTMCEMIREAAVRAADIVVFPELAVTGTGRAEVEAATPEVLDDALIEIGRTAREEGIYTLFGMPFFDRGERRNGIFVLDRKGELCTRHAQLVVDRPELFTPGSIIHTMWFRLDGVPAVVTLGYREALWNEIAELAAVRGALLHFHLCNIPGATSDDHLRRRQIWTNMALIRRNTSGSYSIRLSFAAGPTD